MKQRIGAIGDKSRSVTLVLVVIFCAGLLASNRYSARPQDPVESQIGEEPSSAQPLTGVTSSMQNPLQMAILHWYNANLTTQFTTATAAPEVKLSPTSLKFPTQLVGIASKAQTVTLTNIGSATLKVTAIVTNSAFTETNDCGSSVTAGASCMTHVTFKPSKAGSVSGTLSFSDNALGSPQRVPLSGTGTEVKLTPSQLNFGKVAVGKTSIPMTVTLTNTGKTVLDITGIDFTGSDPKDFVETNTCGSSVAAGASCRFSVRFTPESPGNRSADLTIKDTGGGSPQVVGLRGTGE